MITIKSKSTLDDKIDSRLYPYRSQEHKSIADMLSSYGIPFFYKQPMLVIQNGQRAIEYSDFFLPTYNGLAIDYIVESNSGVFRRKKNVYQDNQIPAVLISRKDLHRQGWQKQLYHKLESVYRKREKYG